MSPRYHISKEEIEQVERDVAESPFETPAMEEIGLTPIANRKAQVLADEEAGPRRRRREQKQRERECFWTWPWGHVWHWRIDPGPHWSGYCKVCDKHEVRMR